MPDDGRARGPCPGALRPILALVALGSLVKLALVLAAPEIYPRGAYSYEEFQRGHAALELLRGPLLPIWDYQGNPFTGGSLVMSFLAALLYPIFGSSLAALRATTLVFHALAVTCAFRILDRDAGRRAAWIGGLLVALAPPGYLLVGTIAWGTHVEAAALSLLVLDLYLARPRSRRRELLLGLAAGFALYFSYASLVVLLLIALAELARGPRRLLERAQGWRALGFAIGFAPWLGYNLHAGFRGTWIYRAPVWEHFALLPLGERVVNGARILALDLPTALWLPASLGGGGLLAELWILALLAGLAAALWHQRPSVAGAAARPPEGRGARTPLRVVLAYPLLYLAIFALSDFHSPHWRDWVGGYRYAMPLFPFLALAAALVLARALDAGGARRLLGVAGVALLAAGSLAGTAGWLDPSRVALHLAAPGHSHWLLGRQLVTIVRGERERIEAVVGRAERWRTPAERDELYYGWGQALFDVLSVGPPPGPEVAAKQTAAREALALLRERVEPDLRHHFEEPAPLPGSPDRAQRRARTRLPGAPGTVRLEEAALDEDPPPR